MKTSVVEVRAMLSVWSVDEVERRIGEVPGVESVTVNHAGGSATVRYDETRLEIAHIKAAVRQRGYESAAPVAASAGDVHEGHPAPGAPRAIPVPAAPKTVPIAPATPGTASAGTARQEKAVPATAPSTPGAAAPQPPPGAVPAPGAPSTPVAAEPKAALDGPAAPAPAASAADSHKGHAAPGAQAAKPTDMAHEMGHGGKDLPAMVRDTRNRFWICLIFTVPIFIYAPMGGFFEPPAPPFGLKLDLWLFFFASAAILYPSWPFVVSAWRALTVSAASPTLARRQRQIVEAHGWLAIST